MEIEVMEIKTKEDLEKSGIVIKVVSDEPCPVCGAMWGHEDKSLDFCNRPKVADEHGWWWKCYNESCPCAYYNPEAGVFETTNGKVQSYTFK